MTTYFLSSNNEVSVRRCLLTVTLTASSGRVEDVQVVARPRSDGGAPPDAKAVRAGMLVLRRVDDPIGLELRPADGAAGFPPDTVVTVTVRTERDRDREEDVVVVRDVHLSWVPHPLLKIIPVDDRRLTVRAEDVPEDLELGPLAEAARAAARTRLGCSQVAHPAPVLVAVDMSASVRPLLDDGSVAAALDVAVGLAQVVGTDRALDVCLLGDGQELLERMDPRHLSADTVARIAATGPGCGFRSTPAPAPPDGTVSYVVTDGVPADLAALRAAREAGQRRHLVLLAGGAPAPGVPGTVLPVPPAGRDAGAHLLADRRALAGVVGTMAAEFAGPEER